jgi:hypothetical protein
VEGVLRPARAPSSMTLAATARAAAASSIEAISRE